MAWVVKLVEIIDGKLANRSEVSTLDSPVHLESLNDLGLRLADAYKLLAHIQTAIVTRQIEHDAGRRSVCWDCGKRQRLKDNRPRQFDTLFGRIVIALGFTHGFD